MAAKPCHRAGEELAGATLWPVPTLSPGILGVTWGVGLSGWSRWGSLPWRGPEWDPRTEATLPPLLPPRGQAAACWEGSPVLMNKLLSLLTARTGLWGIKGARAWETATNLMKRMDSRCGLWPSPQLPSLGSWMGRTMRWGHGRQRGVRPCATRGSPLPARRPTSRERPGTLLASGCSFSSRSLRKHTTGLLGIPYHL